MFDFLDEHEDPACHHEAIVMHRGDRGLRVVKRTLRRPEQRARPQRVWERLLAAENEPEMAFLPVLVDPHRTTIDVGAALGQYTTKLAALCSRCVAFEARPDQARRLARLARAVSAPVLVEPVALSDESGGARLRVLTMDPGRSTIEEANALEDDDGGQRPEIVVPSRPLDAYGYDDVGFVKIDVEGHELAVLEGARVTIEKCKPTMLIEIEERHRPNAVRSVVQFLQGMDYAGRFLLNGKLVDVDDFDVQAHQDPSRIGGWRSGWERRGVYVNNFVFVPVELMADVERRIASPVSG